MEFKWSIGRNLFAKERYFWADLYDVVLALISGGGINAWVAPLSSIYDEFEYRIDIENYWDAINFKLCVWD